MCSFLPRTTETENALKDVGEEHVSGTVGRHFSPELSASMLSVRMSEISSSSFFVTPVAPFRCSLW